MTGSQTSFGISVTDKRQHKDTKGLRRRSRLDQRTTSQLKQLKRRHSVSKGFIESYQQTERKKRTNNRQGFHLSAAEVQDSLKKPSEQNWELQLASIATSVLQMLMLSECTDTGGKKRLIETGSEGAKALERARRMNRPQEKQTKQKWKCLPLSFSSLPVGSWLGRWRFSGMIQGSAPGIKWTACSQLDVQFLLKAHVWWGYQCVELQTEIPTGQREFLPGSAGIHNSVFRRERRKIIWVTRYKYITFAFSFPKSESSLSLPAISWCF